MNRIDSNKKPPISPGGANSNKQATSGDFQGKSVVVPKAKDAEKFIPKSDAAQSSAIQQSIPTAPLRTKRAVKLPSKEASSLRPATPTSPPPLPPLFGAQPQDEESPPPLPPRERSSRPLPPLPSEVLTDSQQEISKPDKQASLVSRDLNNIVSPILEETERLIEDCQKYAIELETDIATVMERENEVMNPSVKTFQKPPQSAGESRQESVKGQEDLRFSFQKISPYDVGKLRERIANQHHKSMGYLMMKLKDKNEQLAAFKDREGLKGDLRDKISQNLELVAALQRKFKNTSETLFADAKKLIGDKSLFKDIEMERSVRSKVINGLMDIEKETAYMPKSVKEMEVDIAGIEKEIRAMKSKNVDPKLIADAFKERVAKAKDGLNEMMIKAKGCEQLLADAKSNFGKSLKLMSATESTYAKRLHEEQAHRVSTVRRDINICFKTIKFINEELL